MSAVSGWEAALQFLAHHRMWIAAFFAVLVAWCIFECWARWKGPPRLSTAELVSLINADSVLLVDIRVPADFIKSHIAGAESVPATELPQFAEQRREELAHKQLVLVCDRGQQAWRIACQHAILRPRILSEGMAGWLADGLPVTRGK